MIGFVTATELEVQAFIDLLCSSDLLHGDDPKKNIVGNSELIIQSAQDFFQRAEDKIFIRHKFLSREKRDIAITFVCLSVCLFVCLLAGFLINYRSDFDEIWWVGR